MTGFETAELTFSLVGYGMTAMALYFTVVSGYLIVAYLVGEQLSKSQMIIVSSLFSVFAFSLVFGSYSFFLLKPTEWVVSPPHLSNIGLPL